MGAKTILTTFTAHPASTVSRVCLTVNSSFTVAGSIRGFLPLSCTASLDLVPKPVHAHGGVIIDSGYTPQYEWLVAINPYPTTPGPTTITILVYDVQTHQPVIDLQAELLLAAPVVQSPVANKVSTMVPYRCSQIRPFTLVTIQLLWS